MDQEVTFSLSYELLTQKAEEEIRNINLNQDGMDYIEALAKASAILKFWYGLALQGYPDTTMDERVEADRLRLHAHVFQREG